MSKRVFLSGAICVMALVFLVWTQTSPFWLALREFSGAMRLIHSDYVDSEAVDYNKLTESAIRGMVEDLDPYSSYMNASQFKRFKAGTEQSYIGIGVEIQKVGDWVTVMTVFPGSSAEEGGLLPGDQITAVGEHSTEGESVEQVSSRLLGVDGESVQVHLHRPSTNEQLQCELLRKPVNVASIRDASFIAPKIGYMRIVTFGKRTTLEFMQLEADFFQAGMNGLLIDLRDNPGGLLSIAKEMAGLYLKSGERVVELRGRDAKAVEVFRAGGELADRRYPIIVLINGQSASAAEIFAGVLQDKERATILGSASYGKGSVQSIYSFPNGSGLRQTTALYYLPSGRSIHKKGVEPDIAVEVDVNDWLHYLIQERNQDLMDDEAFEGEFGFRPNLEDRALQTAVEWMKENRRVSL